MKFDDFIHVVYPQRPPPSHIYGSDGVTPLTINDLSVYDERGDRLPHPSFPFPDLDDPNRVQPPALVPPMTAEDRKKLQVLIDNIERLHNLRKAGFSEEFCQEQMKEPNFYPPEGTPIKLYSGIWWERYSAGTLPPDAPMPLRAEIWWERHLSEEHLPSFLCPYCKDLGSGKGARARGGRGGRVRLKTPGRGAKKPSTKKKEARAKRVVKLKKQKEILQKIDGIEGKIGGPVIQGRGDYKTGRAKKLGQNWGGQLGTKIGGWLGGAADALFGSIIGAGDYADIEPPIAIANNSIMGITTPAAANVPMMHRDKESTRITHREYIGDIGMTTAFYNGLQLNISPTTKTLFPWLSSMTPHFQEWKMLGAVIEYKTLSSLTTGAAAGMGSVSMMIQYDVYKPAPINKTQALNVMFAVSGRPCDSMMLPIECDPNETPNQPLYMLTDSFSPPDLHEYVMGKFFLITVGGQAVYPSAGELWITYDIMLMKPIMPAPGSFAVMSHFPLSPSDGDDDFLHQLTVPEDFKGISAKILANEKSISFDPDLEAGTSLFVLLTMYGEGKDSTLVMPNGTTLINGLATGAELVSQGDDVQNVLPEISSLGCVNDGEGYFAGFYMGFYVYDGTGTWDEPPTLTFTGGSGVTDAFGGDLIIFQTPPVEVIDPTLALKRIARKAIVQPSLRRQRLRKDPLLVPNSPTHEFKDWDPTDCPVLEAKKGDGPPALMFQKAQAAMPFSAFLDPKPTRKEEVAPKSGRPSSAPAPKNARTDPGDGKEKVGSCSGSSSKGDGPWPNVNPAGTVVRSCEINPVYQARALAGWKVPMIAPVPCVAKDADGKVVDFFFWNPAGCTFSKRFQTEVLGKKGWTDEALLRSACMARSGVWCYGNTTPHPTIPPCERHQDGKELIGMLGAGAHKGDGPTIFECKDDNRCDLNAPHFHMVPLTAAQRRFRERQQKKREEAEKPKNKKVQKPCPIPKEQCKLFQTANHYHADIDQEVEAPRPKIEHGVLRAPDLLREPACPGVIIASDHAPGQLAQQARENRPEEKLSVDAFGAEREMMAEEKRSEAVRLQNANLPPLNPLPVMPTAPPAPFDHKQLLALQAWEAEHPPPDNASHYRFWEVSRAEKWYHVLRGEEYDYAPVDRDEIINQIARDTVNGDQPDIIFCGECGQLLQEVGGKCVYGCPESLRAGEMWACGVCGHNVTKEKVCATCDTPVGERLRDRSVCQFCQRPKPRGWCHYCDPVELEFDEFTTECAIARPPVTICGETYSCSCEYEYIHEHNVPTALCGHTIMIKCPGCTKDQYNYTVRYLCQPCTIAPALKRAVKPKALQDFTALQMVAKKSELLYFNTEAVSDFWRSIGERIKTAFLVASPGLHQVQDIAVGEGPMATIPMHETSGTGWSLFGRWRRTPATVATVRASSDVTILAQHYKYCAKLPVFPVLYHALMGSKSELMMRRAVFRDTNDRNIGSDTLWQAVLSRFGFMDGGALLDFYRGFWFVTVCTMMQVVQDITATQLVMSMGALSRTAKLPFLPRGRFEDLSRSSAPTVFVQVNSASQSSTHHSSTMVTSKS